MFIRCSTRIWYGRMLNPYNGIEGCLLLKEDVIVDKSVILYNDTHI